jgi:hypothetical protein
MSESPLPQPPPKPPQASGFRRLVVMLAVVAAAAAAVVVVRDAARPPEAPPGLSDPAAPDDAPEDSLTRALRLAGVDSTKKNAWVDEIPSVDLTSLDPKRTEVFLRFANARRCTCGCGFTLAACRVYDPSCEVSGPLVAALLDSVARGLVGDARAPGKRPESAPDRRASE